MIILILCTKYFIVPCWSHACVGDMGIWDGGCVPLSSAGPHESCGTEKCCHSAPNHSAACAPGTIVHSDQWASYNQVGNLPNVAVNHSVEFVSPTGVHTQNVESYWNRAKIKLKRMRGCAAQEVPSYLMSSCGVNGLGRQLGRPWMASSATLHSNILCDFSLLSLLGVNKLCQLLKHNARNLPKHLTYYYPAQRMRSEG